MSDPYKEVGKKVLRVVLERYVGPHTCKVAMDADPENPPPFKKRKYDKTDGQEPSMDVSLKSKVAGKDLHAQRKVGQSSRKKDRNPKGKRKEKKESRTHEGRSRPANVESIKREKLLLKERLRMLKAVDRAKRKQEKLKRERLAKEARVFKEDLECEDLKVLPTFSEVQCCIPNENFADLMVLLEFVHSFKEVLPVNDFFPHGFSFDVAERALSVEEADGTFSDIIQLLMTGFFKMQGLDDEIENSTEPGQLKIDLDDDIERALEHANATRKYTRLCHGVQLKQFRLDAFSLSEVVRLHFLTSGGYMKDGRTKYRYLHGGYCDRDDPGLTFCIAESKLLNDIAYRSIQELALGDKLKIILCLIHQLLTFPKLRDILDDRCEKIRPLKNSLRIHSRAEKKLSDSLTLRLKERNATKPKGAEEMPCDAQNITDEDLHRIEKEILHKRQKITKTAKELAEISMSFQSLPLGTDRFFRRYWRFSSLPGLFIEHQGGASIEALSSGAAYKFSAAPVSDIGDNPAKSDKENDDNEGCKSRSSNSPTKKMLEANNSNDSLTSEKLGAALQSSNKVENDPKDVNLHQNVVSTKNREFLGSSEPVWSFCCKEDDFNLLVERLNPRGIREGHLRQVLLGEKEIILESILACPAVKLNPTFVDETIVPEVRKSSRNNPASSKDRRNFGHPLGTPLPEIWSQLLRDEILDTDDRLYRGGLGAVQVQNRDAWREALLNKTYDKQCDRLVWGCQAKSDKQESSECSIKTGSSEDIESTDPEFQRVMKSPFHFVQLSLMDPGVIKAYACAILQVEQGIPKKNLKHSFVADKPGEEISQLERWEMSLMSSTSYSQLYVHLLTLRNNIHSTRSALKAHCRACRQRYDAENILLCDECNRGYHIYCLTPKLNRIPQGDWYCSACQPKVAAQRNKRQHRSTSEEHEAEASACKPPADRCDVCGLSSTSFACTTCHRRFHVQCCDPTKMKRTSSDWQCGTCTLHETREIKKAGSSLCSKSPVGEDSPLASSNNDGGGSGAAINLTSICQKVDFEGCNPSSSQAEADPSNELAESPLVSSNDAEASLSQEPVDTPLASSNNDGVGSSAAINLTTSICQKVDFEGCNPSSSQAEADPSNELAESPLVSRNDAEASLPQEPVDTPLASSNNDGVGSSAAINLTSICQKVDFEGCNPSSSQAEADPSNELAESPLVSSNDAEANLPQEPVDTPLASSNNDGVGSSAAINLTSICQKVDFEGCNPSSSQAEADPSNELAESPLVSSNDAEASLPQEPVDTPLASSNNDGGGSGAAINLTSICQKVDFEGCNPSSSKGEADPSNELVESPLVSSNDAEASLPQEPVDIPLASSKALNPYSVCESVNFDYCNPAHSLEEAGPKHKPAEHSSNPSQIWMEDGASPPLKRSPEPNIVCSQEVAEPSKGPAERSPSPSLSWFEDWLVSLEGNSDTNICSEEQASHSQEPGERNSSLSVTGIVSSSHKGTPELNILCSQEEAGPSKEPAERSPNVSLTWLEDWLSSLVGTPESNHSRDEADSSKDPVGPLHDKCNSSISHDGASPSYKPPINPSVSSNEGDGGCIEPSGLIQRLHPDDYTPSQEEDSASSLLKGAPQSNQPCSEEEAGPTHERAKRSLSPSIICIKDGVMSSLKESYVATSRDEADPLHGKCNSSNSRAEDSPSDEPADTPLISRRAVNLLSVCRKLNFDYRNPLYSQNETDPSCQPIEQSTSLPLTSVVVQTSCGASSSLKGAPEYSQEEPGPSCPPAEHPLLTCVEDSAMSSLNEPHKLNILCSQEDTGPTHDPAELSSSPSVILIEDDSMSSINENNELNILCSKDVTVPTHEPAELSSSPSIILIEDGDMSPLKGAPDSLPYCSRDEASPTREPAERHISPLLWRDIFATSSVKGSPSSSDSEESDSSVEAEKGSTGSSLAASLDVQVVSKSSSPISMTSSWTTPTSSPEGEFTSSLSSPTSLLETKIASRDSSPCSSYGEKAASRDSSPCSSYGKKAASRDSTPCSSYGEKATSRDSSPCSSYGKKAASRDSSPCSSYGEKATSRDSSPCSSYGKKAASKDSSPCSSYGEKAASWCSNTTTSSLEDNITPRRRSRSSVRKDMMAPRRSSRSSERADKLKQFNRDLMYDLLSELMSHKDGWPFVKPIPRRQFPDYHSVVRRPMDFTTVKSRLNSRRYRSNMEFLRDIMLIFTNWEMYNSVDEELSSVGKRLQNYFYKRCKELDLLKCQSKESTRL